MPTFNFPPKIVLATHNVGKVTEVSSSHYAFKNPIDLGLRAHFL
jgi:hypothetical protein